MIVSSGREHDIFRVLKRDLFHYLEAVSIYNVQCGFSVTSQMAESRRAWENLVQVSSTMQILEVAMEANSIWLCISVFLIIPDLSVRQHSGSHRAAHLQVH
jgi:hypothetical protein